MSKETEQLSFLNDDVQADDQPVVCLGMTFKNDEERREYFRRELRKKFPELKKIEGFPIGDDDDIIALSNPPYYTVCPNPWLNEFIEEWEKEKIKKYNRQTNEAYQREPFAADVSEGKSDAIYTAHNYHTKVPHKAIMRYLLHYTNPGDIVLDCFSGTGMTGVAAQMCADRKMVESLGYLIADDGNILDNHNNVVSRIGSRNAVLGDLSPIASFIAYNYNYPVSSQVFEQEALRIMKEVEHECGWMFKTAHIPDITEQSESIKGLKEGDINYTVWSDVFLCSNCSEEIVFFDVAMEQETKKVRDSFDCPHCNATLVKRNLERALTTEYDNHINMVTQQTKRVPVLINYRYNNQNYEKRPDTNDFDIIRKIDEVDIHYWFPTNPIMNVGERWGDTWRAGYHTGMTHVHHFYSKRALYTLAKVFNLIRKTESPIKSYLLFAYEQSVLGFSRLARYVPTHYSQVNQFLSGTMYVGSQIVDVSLPYIMGNKIKKLTKLLKEYNTVPKSVITTQAAQSLVQMASGSIDYIFTDPPFGANLMYSELNSLWESWLGITTANENEAIVNKSQGKGLIDYQSLMLLSFKEYYRVLKPGHWMTVEFSNSQASVWNTIQEAIQKAGFVIANVSTLDKKQGSFKAVTSTTAVKQDLVISAYKPKDEYLREIKEWANTEESAWGFVRQHLHHLPVFMGSRGEASVIPERIPRILFDRMIAYHVQNGLAVPISSADFQMGVTQRFPMRDGMAFLESQVAEYDKKRTLVKEFSQLTLFVSDETSAIEWIRQQLMKKPQTRQDLHPNFIKEIQHIAKHEMLPELDDLLYQNFLRYEDDGNVPDQIVSYLRKNYKDLRGLENDDAQLKEKALNRWYVPDPNKQADLEKLREKSLMREFEGYVDELTKSKKKLKQFRTEAIRAGFKKAWGEKDYQKIVTVGDRLPESVIQEDDKLLMYYDNAQIRLGL